MGYMKKFRVLVTGGGSGGHIYPIIAVVTELQLECAKQNIPLKINYLGAYGPYKELLKANNLKVHNIVSSKIRRYFSIGSFFANILEIPKFIFSFIQALWGVFWFMPDVLFSKGGPGSVPVILAASFYRIPIVVHESDSAPGLSNMVGAKHAKKIAISFPGVEKYFSEKSKKSLVLTGNPVRETMFKNLQFDKVQEKRRFGFTPEDPLLLVIGGSQGSVRINEFIIRNLPLILKAVQVFHQTGKDNYDAALAKATEILKDLPEEARRRYKVVPYFENNMQNAYVASDIIVARAGAGSIFEIAAFGKPSILIPLPESAQDHQRTNAYDYESHGAGLVIEEDNLLPNLFLNKLLDMMGDPQKYQKMSAAAKSFYKPNAALNIAKILLEYRR